MRTLTWWNHRTGPSTAMTAEMHCEAGISYPGREGAGRAAAMAITGSGTTSTRAMKPSLGDGRDVVLTITLRFNSTMTVTGDAQAIATRRYAPPPSGRVHPFFVGHSVESVVRVRALGIWSIGRVR